VNLQVTIGVQSPMIMMVSWLCLCVFMGCMWGVVGAANLCYIGQSHVKDWGFNSPHKLLVCSNLCDCKQNFNHPKFMCICCTYPFVSLILITNKSISSQGRKMNMNSYLSWHIYVKIIWCISLCYFLIKKMLYWYLAISLKTKYPDNTGLDHLGDLWMEATKIHKWEFIAFRTL
jgi:hypothetical protein